MAKMSFPSENAPADQLKFPKPGPPRMLPVSGDENFDAQLLAALERISDAIANVQNTLDVLLHVLTMEEPAATGDPT